MHSSNLKIHWLNYVNYKKKYTYFASIRTNVTCCRSHDPMFTATIPRISNNKATKRQKMNILNRQRVAGLNDQAFSQHVPILQGLVVEMH
jgi:hypothetical protein